jgi:hypothetical protein
MTKSAFPQTNVFSGLKNDWVKLSELFWTLSFLMAEKDAESWTLSFLMAEKFGK